MPVCAVRAKAKKWTSTRTVTDLPGRMNVVFSKGPGHLVWVHGIMDSIKYQDILNHNQAASDRKLKLLHLVGCFCPALYSPTSKTVRGEKSALCCWQRDIGAKY